MTTPNIEAAKERLNRSIANQQELRRRISRSAAELRGDVEEFEDATVDIQSEPVDTNGVGGVRDRI